MNKKDKDGLLLFEGEDAFPKLYQHYSRELQGWFMRKHLNRLTEDEKKNPPFIEIETMYPDTERGFYPKRPSSMGMYLNGCHVTPDVMKIIEEIRAQLPGDFMESIEKSTREIFERTGGSKIRYSDTKTFVETIIEIRKYTEMAVMQHLEPLPFEQKYKNLFLGTVRYKIGKMYDDVWGD